MRSAFLVASAMLSFSTPAPTQVLAKRQTVLSEKVSIPHRTLRVKVSAILHKPPLEVLGELYQRTTPIVEGDFPEGHIAVYSGFTTWGDEEKRCGEGQSFLTGGNSPHTSVIFFVFVDNKLAAVTGKTVVEFGPQVGLTSSATLLDPFSPSPAVLPFEDGATLFLDRISESELPNDHELEVWVCSKREPPPPVATIAPLPLTSTNAAEPLHKNPSLLNGIEALTTAPLTVPLYLMFKEAEAESDARASKEQKWNDISKRLDTQLKVGMPIIGNLHDIAESSEGHLIWLSGTSDYGVMVLRTRLISYGVPNYRLVGVRHGRIQWRGEEGWDGGLCTGPHGEVGPFRRGCGKYGSYNP